jgi:outer membrane protein assembly factor BamB
VKPIHPLIVLLSLTQLGYCADWPAFRGPDGNGITEPANYPTRWSGTENVVWSAPMPRPGNGSPIVVGDKVLVASAEDDAGRKRSLLCFDAATGRQLWNQSVACEEEMPTHKTNPYAGSTPASDGNTVVVWHATAGLHAYSLAGDHLWSRDLGEYRHMWGYGTSPVIVGDRVILHTGPGKQVFVISFDIGSGEELWRHEEPVDGSGERNSDGNYMGSWATPVAVESDGRQLVVCSMATRVCGFDVSTGKLVWYCEGLHGERGDLAYSSPMIVDDVCVAIGGFSGPGLAFRMKGTGNITDQRIWTNARNPQNIGTGLNLDGYVYRVGAGPSMIDCLDAKTGELVWQDRAANGIYWGSLVYDGKLAMATDQDGATIIFEPSPDGLKQVALNQLKDHCNGTPALAEGRIYIRTAKKLWCIGE